MKEFEVTVRLRNNRLKQRRLELGLTQREMAEASGCSVRAYACFEMLKETPFDSEGEWTKDAVALANFHCVKPRELFPEAAVAVTQSTSTRRLSSEEIGLFLGEGSRPALPEDAQASNELRESVSEVLKTLKPREAFVLARRFGIEDGEEHTHVETASVLGLTNARVGQIEAKALRKLRQSNRSNKLQDYRSFREEVFVPAAPPNYFTLTKLREELLREASREGGFRFLCWSKKGAPKGSRRCAEASVDLSRMGMIDFCEERVADTENRFALSEIYYVCKITPRGVKFLEEGEPILLNAELTQAVLVAEEAAVR